ncbi:hypothetical protein HU200_008777 [Digitaria exilis]|uniref:Uncharacterized protein n=1 Tax=Digitaria exilis TaxID=1010633 RepID=A0A835FMJ9_9POAL|nr:hypothetical protein HU200_008777 [Digitaria exilis]
MGLHHLRPRPHLLLLLVADLDADHQRRRLPPPYLRLEAPWLFASVGTKIIATHPRDNFRDSVPDGFLPMVDVHSKAINFAPGDTFHHLPIFFSGDGEVYSLDSAGFKTLSLKPMWPPRLEFESRCRDVWSWCRLPDPPFRRFDITSYAMDPREGGKKTLLVSTAMATFAFDTTAGARVWYKPYADGWSMPFTGRAHFVSRLDAFVGLSNDPENLGHLCSCKVVDDGRRRSSFRISKEKLFSEDSAEDHAGATLLYSGESSSSNSEAEFCLVQCICSGDDTAAGAGGMQCASTGDSSSIDDLKPHKIPLSGKDVPRCVSYFYRATTFSLGYDDSNGGGLTTGGSRRVRCYKVPQGITQTSFLTICRVLAVKCNANIMHLQSCDNISLSLIFYRVSL